MQTPIVALTSYSMAGDREKALASGYIENTINSDTFLNQIGIYLPDDANG
jgi:CheY-like chemotaxis protein